MSRALWFCAGLLLCAATFIPLSELRKALPPAERLGHLPSPGVTYFASLEHRALVSELIFYRTMFYYGALVHQPKQAPDYGALYAFLDTATRLNPGNIDAYYFAQAILTWDAKMVRPVNGLLQRGIAKRPWDADLPFYLAFNYYYFLGDFEHAARYFEITARLNPEVSYFGTLTARALYQADKTELAIRYLQNLLKGTKNQAVRKQIAVRVDALARIRFLEVACQRYRDKAGRAPASIEELVTAGVIKGIPPDPYGGVFYLDPRDGRVKTTSNLAETRKAQ